MDGFEDAYEADARAHAVLLEIHDKFGCADASIDEIVAALERLLPRILAPTSKALRYFAAAAPDLARSDLKAIRHDPDFAEELWLDLAGDLVRPFEPTDIHPAPADVLDHAKWISIAIGLNALEDDDLVDRNAILGWIGVPAEHDDDQVDDERLEALDLLINAWRELGVLDESGHVTELGRWGTVHSLLDVWEPDDHGDDEADEERDALPGEREIDEVASLQVEWHHAGRPLTDDEWEFAAQTIWRHGELLSLTVGNDGWPEFCEATYERFAQVPAAAGAAFLRALRAEADGDVGLVREWVDRALAADAAHRDSLELAAGLAGMAGDAYTALDVLKRMGAGRDDNERAVYETFARPAASTTPRNALCPCGSGKKFKLCCGARLGHPLEARANWLWFKVSWFLQRPPQRAELIDTAQFVVGADNPYTLDVFKASTEDLLTWDVALFDGGLLQRFLDTYAALLPADEQAAVAEWGTTQLSAYEVVDVRSGFAITVRDLLDDSQVEVQERTASRQARRGDVLLARLLPVGAMTMFGLVMSIPRLQRSELVDLLRTTTNPGDVAAWVRAASAPPTMQTREGQDLVFVTQRWRVNDAGWRSLAGTLDGDAGEETLNWGVDAPEGGKLLRAQLARDGDEVTVQTNAVERAEAIGAMLNAVGGELIDEQRQTPAEMIASQQAAGPRAVADPTELPAELVAVLEEQVRGHERRWVDDEIPMFGGRRPRDMVKTAAGRREVEEALRDLEVMAEQSGGGPGVMSAARIRDLLGLPTPLRPH